MLHQYLLIKIFKTVKYFCTCVFFTKTIFSDKKDEDKIVRVFYPIFILLIQLQKLLVFYRNC